MTLATGGHATALTDAGRNTGGRTGFAARAAVRAERGPGGRTRITRLRSDGPLALRESGESVYLVGAGAGPLGGDDLELTIDVGPGARLDVRSAAATLVLPGRRNAGASRLVVRADVAAGARLVFSPEPVIAAAGCDHQARAEVTLAEGSELVWREEIVLGRHGEPAGRYVGRFDVTVGAEPLLRHELRIDEDATSGAVLGDAGAVGTLLITGVTAEPYADEGLAVLPLAGPGVLVTAMAADTVRLRERLERGRRLLT
ncbi:urease accessory protein UreD [Actinoallomurus sp. NPDC050550]|uniref:urease accessory protein UreD n=1 Tax=Actinoallomurus sp. NPDC050550 TaxID=3154937 RepID=UPI003408FF78